MLNCIHIYIYIYICIEIAVKLVATVPCRISPYYHSTKKNLGHPLFQPWDFTISTTTQGAQAVGRAAATAGGGQLHHHGMMSIAMTNAMVTSLLPSGKLT